MPKCSAFEWKNIVFADRLTHANLDHRVESRVDLRVRMEVVARAVLIEIDVAETIDARRFGDGEQVTARVGFRLEGSRFVVVRGADMALMARNVSTGSLVADRVGVASTRAERAVGLLSRAGLEPGEALWIIPSA